MVTVAQVFNAFTTLYTEMTVNSVEGKLSPKLVQKVAGLASILMGCNLEVKISKDIEEILK